MAVVAAVRSIGMESNLSDSEWTALLAAAWFHDTGYCYTYSGHEEQSIILAGRFFRHHHQDIALQQQVFHLINATRVPQQPENHLQEIICDADLMHLSQPDYPAYATRLRQEWSICLDKQYSDQEWMEINIRFLQNHTYFSAYAQQYWEPLKLLNLEQLSRI